MFYLHDCLCTAYVISVHIEIRQEGVCFHIIRVMDSLSCHVGVGSQTWILCLSNNVLNCWTTAPASWGELLSQHPRNHSNSSSMYPSFVYLQALYSCLYYNILSNKTILCHYWFSFFFFIFLIIIKSQKAIHTLLYSLSEASV